MGGKIPRPFSEEARQRVYGRRLGRPLSPSRQAALDMLLPIFCIPAHLITQDATLDPAILFPQDPAAETIFEIGFGNGEHLKAMMEARPYGHYIGVEPFINGMSAFLKSLGDEPTAPLRVWMDDAVMVCKSLKDQSIDRLYILNPDPWPKAKHHKRRIVRQETLAEYHRILKPKGGLIMATDVDDLAAWMVHETLCHGGFRWQAQRENDWHTMPKDWFYKTRYAAKGEVAGRKQSYLLFQKI